MNPFPALTVPSPLIFLSNLSNTKEVALVANLGKTFLAKKKQQEQDLLVLFCLNYSSYYLT